MKHFNAKKRVFLTLLTVFAFFGSNFLHAADLIHDISNDSLIIAGSDNNNYKITGSTTTNKVRIGSGYKGTITLSNCSIVSTAGGKLGELSDSLSYPPFWVQGKYNGNNHNPDTKVNIVLEGDNYIAYYGFAYAALQVDQGAQINISAIRPEDNASGSLFARSNAYDPGYFFWSNTGAAIGAPSYSSATFLGGIAQMLPEQGRATIYNADGTIHEQDASTAGGNIIISSGKVTAWGGHGAGIGGGYTTYYDGVIIITGGEVEARAGYDAAGIGSGCPEGTGVINHFAPRSALIALPPCKIEAWGAGEDSNGGMGTAQFTELGLTGTKLLTYLNDPAKPTITIHPQDFEKDANIYLDLQETEGLKDIFDKVYNTFDLSHVWIGKTGTTGSLTGKMQVNGWFKDKTTFFTDASSTASATYGRPYMPVVATTPEKTDTTIVLPMFTGDIRFTDYPSWPLVEGYSSAQAEKNAFCLKVEYNDARSFTNLTYELAQNPSDFRGLIFLGPDSSTVIPPPATLTPGQVFFIIVPLDNGKLIGTYSDVILIRGTFDSQPMSGYIRRISDQIVSKDDTGKNEHIKVTADPTSFLTIFPTDTTVQLKLNIQHLGLDPAYDQSTVRAKYIVTTEANYDDITVPLNQWENLLIPATEGTDAETTVSFTGKPVGIYYIHWYAASGLISAHSQDVTSPLPNYGGFGKYEVSAGNMVTYDGNTNNGGAVPVDTAKYTVGKDVRVLGNTGLLTKTDATFIGWSFGAWPVVTAKANEPADLMSPNEKFQMGATDTTLYAVWAVDVTGPGGGSDSIPDYMQLAVTYDGNGNTGGTTPVDANVYNNGNDVTVQPHGNLVHTGAVFIGWSFGKLGVVTSKAGEPSDLMAANDLFKITADTTLYAVWAKDVSGPGGGSDSIPDYMQMTVLYDGNGPTSGTVPVDGNVYNSGDHVTVKANSGILKKTDATFIGWSFGAWPVITAAANEPADLLKPGDTFTITTDTTLYAVWAVDATGPGGGSDSIPDYMQTAVLYDGNGHTSGTVPADANVYNSGDHVTVKANSGILKKTDATFIGWSFGAWPVITAAANEPADLKKPGDTFMITTDTTLYAVWAIDVNGPGGGGDSIPDYDQIAVIYDGNGQTSGTAPMDGNVYNNGDNVTVKANSGTLKKTDATFVGWSFGAWPVITAAANEPTDLLKPGATFTITTDTTLYAVWAVDVTGPGGGGDSIPDYNQFAVLYNGNGQTSGTAPVDANVYNTGDDVNVKANSGLLKKTDATFIGWSFGAWPVVTAAANEPADLKKPGDTFTITTDTMLYAVWAVDVTGPGGGGDSIPDYDQFSVIYDGNGHTSGTVPVDASVYNAGDNVITLSPGNLARTGGADPIVFAGWAQTKVNQVLTHATAGNLPGDFVLAGNAFTLNGHTTMYAVWSTDVNGDSIPDIFENDYSVTYYANGGTGTVPVDTTTYLSGMSAITKDKGSLDRTDCVFIGWNPTPVTSAIATLAEESALTSMLKPGKPFTVTSDMSWYAVWGEDDNDNGIPDYLEVDIIYEKGMIPTPVTGFTNNKQTVERYSTNVITNRGVTGALYVLLGWNTMKVPLVTNSMMENLVTTMGQFYAIGDSITIGTTNVTLYAVWAADQNGDGEPDYGSSIIKPTTSGTGTRGLLSDDAATSNEAITGVRVWSYGNTLYIDSDKAVRASVYTLGGMLFKQIDLPEGRTSEPLDRGIFIVEIDGLRHKVVIKQ